MGKSEDGVIAPQVLFCPLPRFLPTDEDTQTEEGEKPNADLLSSRHRHQGCRGPDLLRGDRVVPDVGAEHGLQDPRRWRPESPDLGCRRALWGSSLPRPREVQRLQPWSGWGGSFRGALPGGGGARLGSPPPPPDPQAPALRQGLQWR